MLDERNLWANVWCLWGDLTEEEGDKTLPELIGKGPGKGPVNDGLLLSLGDGGIGNFFSNSTDNNGRLNSGRSRPWKQKYN